MLNFTADQLLHLFKSNVSECEYERGEEKKKKISLFAESGNANEAWSVSDEKVNGNANSPAG